MFSMDSSYGDSHTMPTTSSKVTASMVRARTMELAISAGRSALEIRQCDYERAKRELTGETDFDRQLAVLYPRS